MFGFDESSDCSPTFLVAYRDETLGYMGKLLVHSFGSVLDGIPFSGRFATIKCFTQILGRHLIPVAYFDYSKITQLSQLLMSLEATQDFVCFHNVESEAIYNELFTVILSHHMQVKEYKSMIVNKISITGADPEKFPARILYLTHFAPNDLLYVGKECRVVSVVKVNLIQRAQFALLSEHFTPSMKLIQLVVIGLTVVEHQIKHQVHFTVKDMRHILKNAMVKIKVTKLLNCIICT